VKDPLVKLLVVVLLVVFAPITVPILLLIGVYYAVVGGGVGVGQWIYGHQKSASTQMPQVQSASARPRVAAQKAQLQGKQGVVRSAEAKKFEARKPLLQVMTPIISVVVSGLYTLDMLEYSFAAWLGYTLAFALVCSVFVYWIGWFVIGGLSVTNSDVSLQANQSAQVVSPGRPTENPEQKAELAARAAEIEAARKQQAAELEDARRQRTAALAEKRAKLSTLGEERESLNGELSELGLALVGSKSARKKQIRTSLTAVDAEVARLESDVTVLRIEQGELPPWAAGPTSNG